MRWLKGCRKLEVVVLVEGNAEPRAGFAGFVYMDCIALAGHVPRRLCQALLTSFVATAQAKPPHVPDDQGLLPEPPAVK